jgi:hypothetical protein
MHIGSARIDKPLQLIQEREEKYLGGHTLWNLLKSHHDATCQDPRDKIYGFVGLAADGRGFPLDYKKSVLEVWRDTMLFMSGQGKLNGSEAISFGKMIKKMLGGSLATMEQLSREFINWNRPLDSPVSITGGNPHVFKLPVFVAGMISTRGPSPQSLISSLDDDDDWRAQIHNNFPDDFGTAFQEHDRLMQLSLSSEKGECGVLSFPNLHHNCDLDPQLSLDPKLSETLFQYSKMSKKSQRVEQPVSRKRSRQEEEAGFWVSDSTACSYQIERITCEQSPWKIGLASGEALPGDFIYWIPEAQTAAVVRKEGTYLRIIGTATAPSDLVYKKKPISAYFGRRESYNLSINLEVLYVLLLEGEGQDRV